jgi:hypothetical protein
MIPYSELSELICGLWLSGIHLGTYVCTGVNRYVRL